MRAVTDFSVALTFVAVQAQEAALPDERDVPIVDEERIPPEPPIEGGVLSGESETRLEPVSSPETRDSLPFDDLAVHEDGLSPSLMSYLP